MEQALLAQANGGSGSDEDGGMEVAQGMDEEEDGDGDEGGRAPPSDDEDDDDDGEDSDGEMTTGIERAAARSLKRDKQQAHAADEEMKTNIADGTAFKFPSGEEKAGSADPQLINQRIKDVLFVLSDFAKNKEEGRPRQDYVSMLRDDMANYFGYLPELIERFLQVYTHFLASLHSQC
jgi:hypothetical protein